MDVDARAARRVGVEPLGERARGEAPELAVEAHVRRARRAARDGCVVAQPEGVRVQRLRHRRQHDEHAQRPRHQALAREPLAEGLFEHLGDAHEAHAREQRQERVRREPVLGAAEDRRARREPRRHGHEKAQEHQGPCAARVVRGVRVGPCAEPSQGQPRRETGALAEHRRELHREADDAQQQRDAGHREQHHSPRITVRKRRMEPVLAHPFHVVVGVVQVEPGVLLEARRGVEPHPRPEADEHQRTEHRHGHEGERQREVSARRGAAQIARAGDREVRDDEERNEPRVVLRLEGEAPGEARREGPPDAAGEGAPVRVEHDDPHGHHRHVEAVEVRVVEDPGHEREGERGHDARTRRVRAVPEDQREPHAEGPHHHARKAERQPLRGDPVPALVEEEPREPEERLHQRRVLVVRAPGRVDGAAREGDVAVVEQPVEPPRVVRRGVEVEALVARVAEGLRAAHEHRDVRRRQRRAQRVELQAVHEALPARAHRASPSKQ